MPRTPLAPRSCTRRTRRRNRQVEAHRHLVAPIAAHYAAHSPEPREDLEQVGLLGLIRAAELFDRGLAVPFSAYARRHVRGAILHYLRDTAPLVRPSRRVQEQRQQHLRRLRDLECQLGRTPTSEELRLAEGLSPDQWGRQDLRPWEERYWLMQQELAASNADHARARSQGEELLAALERLERPQREVVEAVVLQGQSLRNAARSRGSSAATVHRLLHRGLRELRVRLSVPSDAPAC